MHNKDISNVISEDHRERISSYKLVNVIKIPKGFQEYFSKKRLVKLNLIKLFFKHYIRRDMSVVSAVFF